MADSELILVNQKMHDECTVFKEAATPGDWFLEGEVSPLHFRANLLFMEGGSNGGLVWRLEDDIDLSVGSTIKEAGLQEACRSLLVSAPFRFVSRALAVWTSVHQSASARAQDTYRSFGRGTHSIRSFVLRCHGQAVVDIAAPIAQKRGLDSRLVETLAYSGYPHLAGNLIRGSTYAACRGIAKGLAIRAVQTDPCGSFIRPLATRAPRQRPHS